MRPGSGETSKPLTTDAEQVRRACLEAAIAAYEEAGLRGLCAEGRWECALEAMRLLNLSSLPAQRDT